MSKTRRLVFEAVKYFDFMIKKKKYFMKIEHTYIYFINSVLT